MVSHKSVAFHLDTNLPSSASNPTISAISTPLMEKEATHLERLLREAYSSQQEILHYNQDKKCLSVWVWYVAPQSLFWLPLIKILRPLNEAGRRISPAELGDYCEVRGIFLPYCLCPLKSKKTRAYPQASIYKPQGGTHAETYVMHCAGSEARQNCGYLGKLLRREQSWLSSSFTTLLSSTTTAHICTVYRKSIYWAGWVILSDLLP